MSASEAKITLHTDSAGNWHWGVCLAGSYTDGGCEIFPVHLFSSEFRRKSALRAARRCARRRLRVAGLSGTYEETFSLENGARPSREQLEARIAELEAAVEMPADSLTSGHDLA